MERNSRRTLIICTVVCSLAACAGGGSQIGGGSGGGGGGGGGGGMPTNPLNYVSWGPWSAGGNVGAAPSGTPTSLSAMPKSGTANYSGSVYATNGATGTTKIGVDFGKASVNMDVTISNVTAKGAGSVTGNDYNVQGKQTASFDVPIVPYSYDFAASGAFYGPNASETAGTFTLSTESPLFSTKQSFEGTFGAKK